MTQYDPTNRGALFSNRDKKTSENFPDYGGSLNVEGREYFISAWLKDGPKGKFMSLSVKPKEAAAPAPRTAQRPPPPRQSGGGYQDPDSDVPFSPMASGRAFLAM